MHLVYYKRLGNLSSTNTYTIYNKFSYQLEGYQENSILFFHSYIFVIINHEISNKLHTPNTYYMHKCSISIYN